MQKKKRSKKVKKKGSRFLVIVKSISTVRLIFFDQKMRKSVLMKSLVHFVKQKVIARGNNFSKHLRT